MLTSLWVEASKLNRSLAALLAVAAPVLIGVLCFFTGLRADEGRPWDLWIQSALGIWAFFMMPMSVTALTALVAQMEHAPKSWDHLRSLPLPRWRIYAAKAICTFLVVAAMTVWVIGVALLAAGALSVVAPEKAPVGELDLAKHLRVAVMILFAGLAMFAVQLWLALRFNNFVPALAVGIGGTMFAVVATSSEVGVFFPWQMPVNMLATEGWRVTTALTLGAAGGLVLLLAMLIDLSRNGTNQT